MMASKVLRHVRLLAARAAASPHQRPSRSPLSALSRAQTQMASASSWAILGSIPRVAPSPDGADVSIALTAPPRVSILTVSPRVFHPHRLPARHAAVLPLRPRRRPLKPPPHPGHPGPPLVPRSHLWRLRWRDPHVAQLRPALLRPRPRRRLRVPPPRPRRRHHAPGPPRPHRLPCWRRTLHGRGAAALIGSDKATLLCFESEAGKWVHKRVHYPLPPRQLEPINVVSHHGRLWWVDLGWGVITTDPFADHPVLRFVPFPPDRVLGSREAWGVADRYRCVAVSAGKLRFVDTIYMGPVIGGTPNISVWTLPGPDSTEWTLEHEVSFGEIWADQSYKATGLPMETPTLALIHPDNPDVVYFFLERHLFGVDVRARKVVDCKVYDLVAPPRCGVASRFVRAWKLPQQLSSGMFDWSDDPILTEKDKAPHGSYPLEGHTMVARLPFI